jgi:hypothetical protein
MDNHFSTPCRNVRWKLFKPGIATADYTNHAKEIPFAWFAVKINKQVFVRPKVSNNRLVFPKLF